MSEPRADRESVDLSSAKRALLEQYLQGRAPSAAAPSRIEPRTPGCVVPLSVDQEPLWHSASAHPDLPINTELISVTMRGRLDVPALMLGFELIARRHEILRTSIIVEGGRPTQRVSPSGPCPVSVIDLRTHPDGEQEARRVATRESRRIFDLARGPLWRATVAHIADDHHTVFLAMHHLIVDCFSAYNLFVPELAAAYESFAAERSLATLIDSGEITHAVLPPAVLPTLPETASFGSLDVVVSVGDRLPPAAARRWSRGRHRLFNSYGPIEVAGWAAAHRCTPEVQGSTPVGRPIAGTRIYVLDVYGAPAPIGVAGELYIGGAQLARGYARRPASTAERFVPDPYGPPGGRLYRTGDIGRWRPDGTVELLEQPDPQGLETSTSPPHEYEAPIDAIEVAMADVWATLLRLPRVGRHDNFFELGGHSLLAVTLIERLRERGLHADVRTLFTQPTVAGLANAIRAETVQVQVPPNLIPPSPSEGAASREVEYVL